MPGVFNSLFGGYRIDDRSSVGSQDIALGDVPGLDAAVEELPGCKREEKKNNSYGPDSEPGEKLRTARKNVMMSFDR